MKKLIHSTQHLLTIAFVLATFIATAQTQLYTTLSISPSALTDAQREQYNTVINSGEFASSTIVSIGDLSTVQQSGKITLALPSGSPMGGTVTYTVRNIEYESDQDFTWYGQVDEDTHQAAKEGELLLLRKNGEYFGNFRADNELYNLSDLTDGRVLLSKSNATPATGICPVPEGVEEYSAPPPPTTCPIRILVLYTNEAKNQVGASQVVNVGNAGITYTNQAFTNSALTTKLVKVGVELWPGYSELNKNYSTILSELSSSGNSSSGYVNARKVALGADIVVLLVRESKTDQSDQAIGIANLAPSSGSGGYAVSWTSTVENVVFAHEVGHLLGADHEPCSASDATTNCSNATYNWHAHSLNISSSLNKKTIVWGNYAQGTHIAHYSNPDVNFMSTPTGTTTRNNALRIKNRTCIVAGFNPSEGPLEGYIDAPNFGCQGDLVLAEAVVTSPVNPSVTYKWYKSTNGGTTFTLINSTNAYVSVSMPPAPGSVVLKLIITGSGNQTLTLYKTIVSLSYFIPGCKNDRSNMTSEDSPAFTVSVSPNPAIDMIHFAITSPSEMEFTLEISDSKGSVVLQEEGILRSGENSLQTNMTTYPKGVYFYRISSGGKSFTDSFILNPR